MESASINTKIEAEVRRAHHLTVNIEIINNTRGGIQSKLWERANRRQIQVPDVLNNENCTVHPNVELSVPYIQSIRDFTTNVSGTIAHSSAIYNLYDCDHLVEWACFCPVFVTLKIKSKQLWSFKQKRMLKNIGGFF